jgi:predicted HTH transcriptional regulator
MTLVKDLKLMVSSGESEKVEFKIKVNHPEKIAREVVAFANAKGGILLIGVNDDKDIVGVKDPVEEMEILNKCLNERIRPEIKYETELIPINMKRKVILYRIKESRKKPHFLNPVTGAKNGTAYFRFNDRTIQASPELLSVIRNRKKHKRGFLFEYGEIEEQVIKSIHLKESMTIREIQETTGMEKKQVSKALVDLVLGNVLEIQPRDGEDLYFSKQHA